MNSNDNINGGFNGLSSDVNKTPQAKSDSAAKNIIDDDEDIKLDYVSGSSRKNTSQNGVKSTQSRSTPSPKAPDGTRVFSTVKDSSKMQSKPQNNLKAPVKVGAKKASSISLSSFLTLFNNAKKAVSKKISNIAPVKKATTSEAISKMPAESTPPASSKPKKVPSKKKKSSGVMGGVARFVIYIIFVAIASVVCSYIIISVANDMFAFSKDDTVITVEIPENATTKEITKILSKNDIITNPTVFRFYTDYKKGKSTYYTDGYKSGSFDLSPNMNYDDLIFALSNSIGTREVVRLTFPEGSTVDEIIDILVKGGVQNTREEYIDVIQNFEYNYRFINELDTENFKNGRKYRLEGYLFPDTYDFYTDASAVDVINKFLVNFNNKFDATFYDAAKSHGLTVDEIINIASLIEKEARKSEDFGTVSSVFHNRIKNKANYPYLQSDATIQYAFPERKSQITPEDLKYDSPYNTYIYAGLPPSAIANPGLDAITAALYPEDTSYYYFISNNVGETFYAKTLDGHNDNIAKIRKESGN